MGSILDEILRPLVKVDTEVLLLLTIVVITIVFGFVFMPVVLLILSKHWLITNFPDVAVNLIKYVWGGFDCSISGILGFI
jgi:antibiotic biosynthesis monooxygenase (ABM) superfamily enzyme